MRVLIVEHSAALQLFLSRWFSTARDFAVCGQTSEANWAIVLAERARPNLMVLDLEVPGAMELLRSMRRHYPEVRVLALVPPTVLGGNSSMEALAAGAADCLPRPAARQAMKPDFGRQLLRRARAVVRLHDTAVRRLAGHSRSQSYGACSAVVIGSSTGGPEALSTLLPELTELQVPVLIVQHMPPPFPRVLADHLARLCNVPVSEARSGQIVAAGQIVLAPGDCHLQIVSEAKAGVRVALTMDAPVNYFRPAVDVLFASAAEVLGSRVLGVVLSGMGCDGTRGAGLLNAVGATVLAQDEATSAVWGMPGSVVRAGFAEEVVPITGMADVIRRYVGVDSARALPMPVWSTPVSHAVHVS